MSENRRKIFLLTLYNAAVLARNTVKVVKQKYRLSNIQCRMFVCLFVS